MYTIEYSTDNSVKKIIRKLTCALRLERTVLRLLSYVIYKLIGEMEKKTNSIVF